MLLRSAWCKRDSCWYHYKTGLLREIACLSPLCLFFSPESRLVVLVFIFFLFLLSYVIRLLFTLNVWSYKTGLLKATDTYSLTYSHRLVPHFLYPYRDFLSPSSIVKMDIEFALETLTSVCQSTRHHIPERNLLS
jgi:hypothetical protein